MKFLNVQKKKVNKKVEKKELIYIREKIGAKFINDGYDWK